MCVCVCYEDFLEKVERVIIQILVKYLNSGWVCICVCVGDVYFPTPFTNPFHSHAFENTKPLKERKRKERMIERERERAYKRVNE